jgi:hypothetical protein
LGSLEGAATIYAAKPWSPDSLAIVASAPEQGGLPTDVRQLDLKYFLEVDIARDFLGDWSASLETEPTLDAKCARLIQYATFDA